MAVVGAVIGVREAGIDREIIIGVRIHQAGRDRIEALGCLTIAFSDLRAEIAGPAADRIDFEELERPVVSCFQTSSSDSSLKMRTRIGERFGMFLCGSSESSCGGESLVALVGN